MYTCFCFIPRCLTPFCSTRGAADTLLVPPIPPTGLGSLVQLFDVLATVPTSKTSRTTERLEGH